MIVTLFLVASLARTPLPPASEQARDQSAIEAYRRGDFESARGLWTAALEGDGSAPRLSSEERGRILYDIGNAAFRKGDTLEAVGWYTASLRLRPRDADTWKNLEHARASAKLEPADRGDLVATMGRLVNSLTFAESQWLALGAAACWFAVLIAEALRGGSALRRLAVAGLFVTLLALTPWFFHRLHDGRDLVLVVDAAEHGAEVRSEPRADATVIGNVPAGEEVERQDELPGWVKVELPDGSSGWIGSRSAFALTR